MKEKFLNYSMNKIISTNKYNEVKLAELKYGLEGFYMSFTKLAIFILGALLLQIFNEFIIFLLIYALLRGFGFGFHANNSFECWIVTAITFLIFPLMAKYIYLPYPIIHLIIIFSLLSFLFFAPADTKSKPLINVKKRLRNKTFIVLITIVLLFSTIFISNNKINCLIAYACLWQAICVNPLMYKLFHQTFNNYKTYIP